MNVPFKAANNLQLCMIHNRTIDEKGVNAEKKNNALHYFRFFNGVGLNKNSHGPGAFLTISDIGDVILECASIIGTLGI